MDPPYADRLRDDDGCLVMLDVFVGIDHRTHIENIASFPKRFVVTPPNGGPIPFALVEDQQSELGVRITASRWSSQMLAIDDERFLFLCDPE